MKSVNIQWWSNKEFARKSHQKNQTELVGNVVAVWNRNVMRDQIYTLPSFLYSKNCAAYLRSEDFRNSTISYFRNSTTVNNWSKFQWAAVINSICHSGPGQLSTNDPNFKQCSCESDLVVKTFSCIKYLVAAFGKIHLQAIAFTLFYHNFNHFHFPFLFLGRWSTVDEHIHITRP